MYFYTHTKKKTLQIVLLLGCSFPFLSIDNSYILLFLEKKIPTAALEDAHMFSKYTLDNFIEQKFKASKQLLPELLMT